MKLKKYGLVAVGVGCILVSSLLSGCINKDKDKEPEPKPENKAVAVAEQLPDQKEFPMNMMFSNGEGNMGNNMILSGDGSIIGSYENYTRWESNKNVKMVLISKYRGKFGNIKKVDDYTYSMTLESLELDRKVGEVWTEDDTKYEAVEPAGLVVGQEYFFYLPTTPTTNVSQDVLFSKELVVAFSDSKTPTLEYYTLVNTSSKASFFSERRHRVLAENEAEKQLPDGSKVTVTKMNAAGRITGDEITVRSTPSTAGEARGYLNKGKVVNVLGKYTCDDKNAAILNVKSFSKRYGDVTVELHRGYAMQITGETEGDYFLSFKYDGKMYGCSMNKEFVRPLYGETWYEIKDDSGLSGYIFGDYININ